MVKLNDISGFKGILFQAPNYKYSILAVLGFSVLFALASTLFGFLGFNEGFLVNWFFSSLFFLIPVLVYGFLTSFVFEFFFKKRAFLLSFFNLVFLFVGLVFVEYFESFFLFSVGFAYSVNILALVGIDGRKGILPFVFPLMYFGFSFLMIHFLSVFILSVFHIAVFLGVGVGSLLLVYLVESIFQSIVPASAVELFSSFFNKEEMSLDFGAEIKTLSQGLFFDKDGEKFVISIPWLHPGPLRGIGGGSLGGSLIESLNEDFGEGVGGYFWHVPSSHEIDPCDPEIGSRVLEECFSEEPDYCEKGTKVLENDDSSFKVFGQKFGGVYLVFLNVEGVDDFDNSIFREIRESTGKKIIFVDMHQLEPSRQGDVLSNGEEKAEKLREEIIKLLEDLDGEKQHGVKIGTEISSDRKTMALVEEVEDEKYLFLTMNRNGIPKNLRKKLEKLETSEFNKVLFLTTDTHETIKFLEKNNGANPILHNLIEKAVKDLSKVKIGIVENELENVKVLSKKSYNFTTAVNYSVYIFPVLLVSLYLIYLLVII